MHDDRYGYPEQYSVNKCSSCNFAEINPIPSSEVLESIYTDYYPRKAMTADDVKATADNFSRKPNSDKNNLQGEKNKCHSYITAGSKVLDIGCGNGVSLLEITKLGGDAYGTELDKNIKPIADELNLEIHFGDIDTMPYPDDFFDFITMSQLIEHIPDPKDFLIKISKKLKVGGKIILSTPNIESANAKRTEKKWINWHIPYHVNFFSQKSINVLAKETGFKVLKSETTTPMGWVALQYLTNKKERVSLGNKETIWQPRPKNMNTLEYIKYLSFKEFSLRVLALLNSYFTIPAWRIRDKAGKGESFIVFLEKA
ncbi:MAG: class I SAM-dependent methyltransferase [bacterium]|nr:class I SAM-dependent methyltransferase [bacterium]